MSIPEILIINTIDLNLGSLRQKIAGSKNNTRKLQNSKV